MKWLKNRVKCELLWFKENYAVLLSFFVFGGMLWFFGFALLFL